MTKTGDYDAVIAWREQSSAACLDIGEEWELAFGAALPLALWVIRSEASDAHDWVELTRSFAAEGLCANELRLEESSVGGADLREGTILWNWSDEVEKALEQTLQLLYYRGLVKEIPAVKVLGRE